MNKQLKISLFITLLLFVSYTVFAQASWNYSIWFVLKDKNGKIINKEDYQKKRIKLLSAPFGAHSNNRFVFDSITNSFKFSQHTITTSSILVFIKEKDTTVVEVSTRNLYLSELLLTNSSYNLRIWGNEKSFFEKKNTRGYRLIYENKIPFKSFSIEHKDTFNIENLVEVKLE